MSEPGNWALKHGRQPAMLILPQPRPDEQSDRDLGGAQHALSGDHRARHGASLPLVSFPAMGSLTGQSAGQVRLLARRQFRCWCVLAGMGDSGPVNESLEAEPKPLAERHRVVNLRSYHTTTGNHAHHERLDGACPVVRICRVQAIAF